MKFFDRFRRKKKEAELKESAPAKGMVTAAVSETSAVKEEKPVEARAGKADTADAPNQTLRDGTGQAYRVLIKPLITEKSSSAGELGKYSFMVGPEANKIMVKKAVEQVYGVKVRGVNIMNYQGKEVNYGRYPGQRKSWRKAIVTLEKGQHLELFSKV